MGDFRWDVHTSLFLRSLLKPGLPMQYTTADTQRVSKLTLVYFCVTGLDLLGKLDNLSESDNAAVKKWVLSQQVRSAHIDGTDWRRCGFRGGSFGGNPFETCEVVSTSKGYSDNSDNGNGAIAAKPGGAMDEGNLAMTYSALATLVALGGDIAGVGGEAILQELRSLQQQDGSFQASASDSTCDLRFTYCACAVSSMLKNWDGVDRHKTVAYINRCYSFDGGVGLAPGRESCAGSTYCAVASMELMGVLHGLSPARREGLVEWCVNRQRDGFQSRPNKVSSDSCCSFWVGATLDLLGEMGLVDRAPARQFHMSCQNKVLAGGFAKAPDLLPDLLHSFYSVAWLSLSQELEAEEIDVSLGITKRARALLPL
ncbi:unnamed protein product [Ascophyllum nodosum]